VSISVQMPESVKGQLSVLNSQGEPQPFQVVSHDPTRNTYQLLTEAKKVPSLGYQVFHVIPGESPVPTDLAVHGLTLENAGCA
jgi:alpha-mannosidase